MVSIVIPTYNCRRWLGEAINSALNQTYPYCEIIIVDDGSTDGTGEWVQREYGNHIRYVWQENSGRGAARNRGLAMAQGDYIQFLDADDLIAPTKIADHVGFLEAHSEFAAVYGHCLVFQDDDKQHAWNWPGHAHYVSGNILEQEIHNPFLLPIMILARKTWVEQVSGFNVHLLSNEDWDLWLRIALAGAKFYYLPGEVVAWYRRQSGTVARASIHLQSGVIVLRQLDMLMDNQAERNRLRLGYAIGQWQASYGRALIREGERWRGIGELARSLTLYRANWWRTIAQIFAYTILTPKQIQWLRGHNAGEGTR